MYEQKELQGSLFINNKTAANQPDLTGNCVVGGKLYKMAAWAKTATKQDGTPIQFYSIKLSEPQPQQVQAAMPFPQFPGMSGAPVQQAAPVQPQAQVYPQPAQPMAQPQQPVYPAAPQGYPAQQPGSPAQPQFQPQNFAVPPVDNPANDLPF